MKKIEEEPFNVFPLKVFQRILPLVYRQDVGRMKRVVKEWRDFIDQINAEKGNKLAIEDRNNPNIQNPIIDMRFVNYTVCCESIIPRKRLYLNHFNVMLDRSFTRDKVWLVYRAQEFQLREFKDLAVDRKFQKALIDASNSIAYKAANIGTKRFFPIGHLIKLAMSNSDTRLPIKRTRPTIASIISTFPPHQRKLVPILIVQFLMTIIGFIALLGNFFSEGQPRNIAALITMGSVMAMGYLFINYPVQALGPAIQLRLYNFPNDKFMDEVLVARSENLKFLLLKTIPIALLNYFKRQNILELIDLVKDENHSCDVRCLAAFALASLQQDCNNKKTQVTLSTLLAKHELPPRNSPTSSEKYPKRFFFEMGKSFDPNMARPLEAYLEGHYDTEVQTPEGSL